MFCDKNCIANLNGKCCDGLKKWVDDGLVAKT